MFSRLPYFFILYIFSVVQLSAQQPALDSLETALRKSSQDTNRVHLLNQLASKFQFANPAKAMKYAEESISLARKIDFDIGLATAYRLAGVLSVDKSDFNNGSSYYQKAMSLVGGRTDSRSVRLYAMLQHNIGVIYHYREEYDSAVDYYLKAARYYNEVGEESLLFNTYNNLGHIYSMMLDRNSAFKYAVKAFELSEKLKDSTKIGFAAIAFASAKMELKQYDRLEPMLTRSLSIARESDNHYMQGKSYLLMGRLYLEGFKDNSKSLPMMEAALRAMEKAGNEYEIAATYQALGEGYSQNNQHNKAREYLVKALEIGRRLGLLQIEQYVLRNLAEVEERTNNPRKAFEYLKDYIKVNDSLTSKANQKQVNMLEAKYGAEIREYKIGQLEKEKQIQVLSLRQKSTVNYILVASIGVLLLLFMLGYRNYRNHELLAKQQKEMDQQKIRELEKDRQLVAVDYMLKGQEEERSRLAKDLHDGLGGMLSGVKYSLVNMKENSIIDHAQLAVFEKSLNMLDTSISELRRVAHNMMPEALAKFGLDDALKDYCSAFQSSSNMHVQYQSFGMEKRLPAGTEIILYRIVQELLNNTVKHAKATEVIVQLIRTENRVSVTVEDNGKGFDIQSLERSKGAGWSNIRTRVDYLKGKLEMDSQPGQGTSVNVEVTV